MASCGVSGRVRLIGHLRHEELPAMIRSSDVLLAVPWYEPFGITVLEAMACGVPVVASAVGGLLDTVVPGVTGLFARSRDARSIAEATNELLSDETRRRAMGCAGAERVQHCYSWQRIAEQTEHSYRRALQPSPAGAHVAAWR
jgi:type III pantothenate kinase